MRPVRVFALLVSLVVLVGTLSPSLVWAQGMGGASEKVMWQTATTPAPVTAGERVTLRLVASVEEGWKMYALDSPPPSRGVRVLVDSTSGALARQGDVQQSDPESGYDPNFDKTVTYFAGRAEIRVPFTVASSATAGPHPIEGRVEFMVCNATMCLPPTRAPFEATVNVRASASATSSPADTPSPASTGATTPSEASPSEASPSEASPSEASPSEASPSEASPSDAIASEAPRGEATAPAGGSTTASTPETTPTPDASTRAGGGEGATAPGASTSGASVTGALDGARSSGLWGFLLLAVGAGIAALAMPCVFPMIPVTVSVFLKKDGSGSHVDQALLFGLLVVICFTGLGLILALVLGASGAQTLAANPWVNLLLGLLFVAFALTLFGFYDLPEPTRIKTLLGTKANDLLGIGGGTSGETSRVAQYGGVALVAVSLTLVSFACTAPFVGGLLAATTQGEWFYPIVGMLVFSTTFALPFVGLALAPQTLARVWGKEVTAFGMFRKGAGTEASGSSGSSGAWMRTLKVTLGFVELAAALKFLSNADLVWGTNLLSRPLAIALTIIIFVLAGLYLIGKLRLKDEPATQTVGAGRLLTAVAFLGVALYMVPGLFGARLGSIDAFLPPKQASDVSLLASIQSDTGASSQGAEGFAWYTDDIDAAMTAGVDAGKPVFVDFTGYTCTNCRQMEANVFPQPPVAELLNEKFVLLRLYTDDLPDGQVFQRFQLQLTGTTALPTYAVVDPSDRSLVRKVSGTMSVERFASFLEAGADQFRDDRLATR